MENTLNKILIADDEVRITDLISDYLKAGGFTPLVAADGAEALRLFKENPDTSVVILDIMMPEIDGWQVCREIRKESGVPIIMLTARSEEFDQLMGFESGADDYVTKPFSPAVLMKRIEALIKRASARVDESKGESGLKIDADAYTASLDGVTLELTLKEFEILKYITDNKSHVLTRDQILNAVWGYDFLGDSRTVDSHMARLRTKLKDFGTSHIKTIYGLGYKFEW